MPFEVSWLVEGQIIHANLKGKVTVEEIQDNSALAISMFESTDAPEVRGLAVAGLYRRNPDDYRKRIDAWLDSDVLDERLTGVKHPKIVKDILA